MCSATFSMRTEPQSNGRSHNANYGDFHQSQILFANIDGSDSIPMKRETATAFVDAVFGFVPLATLGTGLRGIPLILNRHFHPQLLGLVSNHLASLPMQHLMDLLIRFFAIINRLPNISYVANHNGLHVSIFERGNPSSSLFVLDIFDLIVKLCQRLLF